jgi:HNH endonuclease
VSETAAAMTNLERRQAAANLERTWRAYASVLEVFWNECGPKQHGKQYTVLDVLKSFSAVVVPGRFEGWAAYVRSQFQRGDVPGGIRPLVDLPFCLACGSKHRLCLHHVVAIAHGGDNWERNLVRICAECHRAIHHWLNVCSECGQSLPAPALRAELPQELTVENIERRARRIAARQVRWEKERMKEHMKRRTEK